MADDENINLQMLRVGIKMKKTDTFMCVQQVKCCFIMSRVQTYHQGTGSILIKAKFF